MKKEHISDIMCSNVTMLGWDAIVIYVPESKMLNHQ